MILTSDSALPEIDSLWNFNDPAATETAFRAVLPEAEERANKTYRLELLTQIARTYSLRSRFDEAHALLDLVEPTIEPGMDRVRVRYLLERGRTLNSSDQPAAARPLFLEAWNLARAAGEDALAVDAAHMVAITESGKAAEQWNLTALDYAEKSTDPKARRWRASLYNNLGWTLHDEGRFTDALSIFEKAVQAHEELGDAERLRIAHWTVGRCLRSLDRMDAALAIQQDQLGIFESQDREPGPYVCEEMAECLYALGRKAESRPWFAKAFTKLSQDDWLVRREPERLQRLERLAAESDQAIPG